MQWMVSRRVRARVSLAVELSVAWLSVVGGLAVKVAAASNAEPRGEWQERSQPRYLHLCAHVTAPLALHRTALAKCAVLTGAGAPQPHARLTARTRTASAPRRLRRHSDEVEATEFVSRGQEFGWDPEAAQVDRLKGGVL